MEGRKSLLFCIIICVEEVSADTSALSLGVCVKTCNKCQISKPLNCFSKRKSTSDGLQWWCKDCKKLDDANRLVNPKSRSCFLFNSAKLRSKKFGGNISITPQWIEDKILSGKCELTGLPFDLQPIKDKHVNPYAPSLDRKDSSNRDYSPENTRVVLASVNAALNEWGLGVLKPIFKKLGEL